MTITIKQIFSIIEKVIDDKIKWYQEYDHVDEIRVEEILLDIKANLQFDVRKEFMKEV